MGGIDRNTDEENDGWPWSHRLTDYKVPYIDAKSELQKRVDALEAQVAELIGLIKELQKGGKDKEVDLL